MNSRQLDHIRKNKKNLEIKFTLLKNIREFFWAANFTEVETPIIVNLPGQEPYLSPLRSKIHDEKNNEYEGFLHTSPEYTMKKMLAVGFQKIFSICKCFRDKESFGGAHNPEFTMLEWYRAGADFYKIMDDVEALCNFISESINVSQKSIKFVRLHMKDLWKKFVDVNLDDYLDSEKMFALCEKKGYKPAKDEPYEDLFYRIFLTEIEPNLKGGIIAHHYPAAMAALAKLSDEDARYAERFEVYINGVEIANAFSELTDAREQLRRLKAEQNLRARLEKEVYEIDNDFIEAVKTMPGSAGIALGVDRLAAIFADCQNIDDVITLPMSKMF